MQNSRSHGFLLKGQNVGAEFLQTTVVVDLFLKQHISYILSLVYLRPSLKGCLIRTSGLLVTVLSPEYFLTRVHTVPFKMLGVSNSAGRYTGSYRIPVFIFLTIWIFEIPQYRCHLNNVWNATLLERGLFHYCILARIQLYVLLCESSETEALVECDEREEVNLQYPHRPPQISTVRCISSRVSHTQQFSVDTTDSRQLQGSRLLKFTFHNFKTVNTLTFLK